MCSTLTELHSVLFFLVAHIGFSALARVLRLVACKGALLCSLACSFSSLFVLAAAVPFFLVEPGSYPALVFVHGSFPAPLGSWAISSSYLNMAIIFVTMSIDCCSSPGMMTNIYFSSILVLSCVPRCMEMLLTSMSSWLAAVLQKPTLAWGGTRTNVSQSTKAERKTLRCKT